MIFMCQWTPIFQLMLKNGNYALIIIVMLYFSQKKKTQFKNYL